MRGKLRATLLASALAGLLAACGGDDAEPSGCAPSAAPSAKGERTILVADTKDAGAVIANAACEPLYTNDVDTAKKISCTGECARVWVPLTIPAKGSVRSESPEPIGLVSLVPRPDGKIQVTLDDKPLYTFTGDEEPGDTTGDGATDQFGGTMFRWSVLTLADAAAKATLPPPARGAPPAGGGTGASRPPGDR